MPRRKVAPNGSGYGCRFVRGWTHYDDPPGFSNLWVIRFDADGRCIEFTEWWMERDRGDTATNPGGSNERGGA